jgi:hypothetical protein
VGRKLRQLAAREWTAATGLATPVPGSFQPSAFSLITKSLIAESLKPLIADLLVCD